MTSSHPEPVAPRRRIALYVIVPLALLLGWGAVTHWRQASDARETLRQSQSFAPDVHVIQVLAARPERTTTLPGQTAAFASADLFARATGFIGERRVDIGSRVHKGDLLVKIDAPDLDQQLSQARAQLGQMQAALLQAIASLKQAQANTQLASINKRRATVLAGEGWDTRQNADTQTTNASVSVANVASAQAGIGVASANVRAQQATVDRLVALTGFEAVTAPFDGTITQRYVDIGALVQGDASGGTPLFHIDQDTVLRCQVYVPQSDFAGIREGVEAKVTVPELPGRVFSARVSRTAAALAQNSRSMLVEIDIPNTDRQLTPGLYVNVTFTLRGETPTIMIPDAALVFDASGLRVATVEPGHRIRMRAVSIAHDFGDEAEIHEGLRGGELVVVNPPSDLTDGQPVHVVDQAAAAQPHGS